MANITSNHIIIKGEKSVIDAFLKKGGYRKGKTLSFSSWLPMPKTFDMYDTDAYPDKYPDAVKYQKRKYGVVGWYKWRMKNYGNKWDSDIEVDRVSDTDLHLYCQTAWLAPIEFFKFISRSYPSLDITMYSHFEEPANQMFVFKGGDCDRHTIELKEVVAKSREYALSQIETDEEFEGEDNKDFIRKCAMMYFDDDAWDCSDSLLPEDLYIAFKDSLDYMDYEADMVEDTE